MSLALLPYSATAVAERLLATLDTAAVRRGHACLGIPGGRSPGPALTALAGMCPTYLRDQLHLFWLDERAVPPGHEDRNDAPTLAAWEAGGALPAHVHPMPADADDLDAAATAYAAELEAASAGAGLDAALIGVGEDGHIASLFPAHPGLEELDPVFAVTDSPKPPPRRLTLSLPAIAQADCQLVLALGQAKGAVAARAAAGPDRTLPASLLQRAVWYADDAALAAAGR